LQQLQQTIQQLQQELDSKAQDNQTKIAAEKLKADAAMDRQRDQNEFELMKTAIEAYAADNQIQIEGVDAKLGQIMDQVMTMLSGHEIAANG